MMIKIFAAVMAVFLCAGHSFAECVKLDRIKSDVAGWNDGTAVTAVNGSNMPSYVAALKKHPGFDELDGATAAVVHHAGKPKVIFVTFGADGCAGKTWFISRELFFELISGKGI